MSRNSWVTVGVAVAAVAVGLFLSRGPWLMYREQRQKADTASREMQKSEKEKADLLRQKTSYDSPIGMEQLAREQKYRRPNEVPVQGGSDTGQ